MARTSKTGVIKRGNNLRIWYIDQNGQRVWETVAVPTIQQASEIRAKRILEIKEGIFVNKTTQSLNEFFETFKRDYLIPNTAEVTQNDYQVQYNRYARVLIGKKNIQKINAQDIYNMYATIRQVTNAGEPTLKNLHAYLRKIFNFAIDLNIIQRNPMTSVKTPKSAPVSFEVWSQEQVDSFLAYSKARNIWTYYPIALTIMTGLRRSEVLGLKWEDVDLEKKLLRLTRTVHQIKGKKYPVISSGKTKKSMATIPMPTVAVNLLHEVKANQLLTVSEFGAENFNNAEGWCFVNSFGKLINVDWLTKSFNRNLNSYINVFNVSQEPDSLDKFKKLDSLLVNNVGARIDFVVDGLPALKKPMNLRGFRHLFATFLLQKNAHPRVVQELLRHTTFKLTMDTYSHVVESMGREAVSLIDESFTESKSVN